VDARDERGHDGSVNLILPLMTFAVREAARTIALCLGAAALPHGGRHLAAGTNLGAFAAKLRLGSLGRKGRLHGCSSYNEQ
jgi:hypothetical protein